MKKFVKITLISTLVLAILGGGLGYYVYSNFMPILKTEINNSLAVKVDVTDISITGLRDFPKLGVKFNKVSIDESTAHYNTKLVEAEEISLFIDLMKMYKGEYVIDAITLRNGHVHIADLKAGSNYMIFKPSEGNDSSSVSFEIKDLKLINCKLAYTHTPSEFDSKAYTKRADIQIKYIGDNTQLRIKTGLENLFLKLEDEAYVNNKNVRINTAIDVNSASEIVSIAQSDLEIEDVALRTEGSVNFSQKTEVNFTFTSNNTKAQSLISVLPESIASSFEHIQLKGDASINGFFKGKMYGDYNPSFGFDYALDNTTLRVPDQKVELKGVSATGLLEIPNIVNLRTAKATCKLNKARTNNNFLKGDLSVTNFERPAIAWNGELDFSLPFLLALAERSDLTASDGRVTMNGKVRLTLDLEKNDIAPNSLFFNGNLRTQGVKGHYNDPEIDIKRFDLDVAANNDRLKIHKCNIEYNSTTLKLSGDIDDFQQLADPFHKVVLRGELVVDNLVLDELIATESDSTEEVGTTAASSTLSPIGLDLKTTLNNFRYNDFQAKSIRGELSSNQHEITMHNCAIDALDGTTVADIGFKKWGKNFLLDVTSDVRNIDITEMFRQFNNFEQEEITHKHLSGRLSGRIRTKIILDQNYEPILPKLYALLNIEINDGQLRNYEPLTELSSFVNIDDLRNVKFSTISVDSIEIFDTTIFIPKIRIENSALNLTIKGTHSFSNYMDYRMELSVAELLATKGNWFEKKKERRIEQNVEGGLTAYIIMRGTPDDLKIIYDRETVQAKVKDEIKEEKQKFIRALKGDASLKDDEVKTKDYDDVWDE